MRTPGSALAAAIVMTRAAQPRAEEIGSVSTSITVVAIQPWGRPATVAADSQPRMEEPVQ